MLREHDLKVTHQRLVIGQYLFENKKHPTAEDVYERIRPNNPSISMATVYKTLDCFVKAGLAQKVGTTEGKTRYDANLDRHDHLYCEESNQIIDFSNEQLHHLVDDYLRTLNIQNFEVSDFQIQINGKVLEKNKPVIVKNSIK
ncbi:MAG: transcriptional repressor [Bacteroidetes bacterium]|nr:transcriptional repressor [Bacteroidota bacterium]